MALGFVPVALLLSSGALVGVMQGLVGGGGSILAVPLLVYLVLWRSMLHPALTPMHGSAP